MDNKTMVIYIFKYYSSGKKQSPIIIQFFIKWITKKWKQPKCPSIDEEIMKVLQIDTVEHYSAVRENET